MAHDEKVQIFYFVIHLLTPHNLKKLLSKCLQSLRFQDINRSNLVEMHYEKIVGKYPELFPYISSQTISKSPMLQDKFKYLHSCFLDVFEYVWGKNDQIENYDVPPLAWFLYRMVLNWHIRVAVLQVFFFKEYNMFIPKS